MRKFFAVFIILLLVNFLTPTLFFLLSGTNYVENEEELIEIPIVSEPSITENENETEEIKETNFFSDSVALYDLEKSEALEVPIIDYLIGVAACEMPSYYESEAIKAQMIAAYSYYLYVMDNPSYLETSLVPVNQSLMQGYASKERLMEYWQLDFDTHYSKYLRAANEVVGDIITYNEEPILASYYAVSSGITQSSQDEWGQSLAYLVNVDSSFDAVSEDYMQIVSYEEQEMYDRLKSAFAGFENLDISKASTWFSDIEYTAGGYVKSVKIDETYVNGTDFRTAMSLASSSFMIFYEDGVFSIATKGYGHGVGMSQFGANELSKQGKGYKEILAYYYPNTIILEKT